MILLVRTKNLGLWRGQIEPIFWLAVKAMNRQKTRENVEYSAQAQKIGTSQRSWFLGSDRKDRGLWGREWSSSYSNSMPVESLKCTSVIIISKRSAYRFNVVLPSHFFGLWLVTKFKLTSRHWIGFFTYASFKFIQIFFQRVQFEFCSMYLLKMDYSSLISTDILKCP